MSTELSRTTWRDGPIKFNLTNSTSKLHDKNNKDLPYSFDILNLVKKAITRTLKHGVFSSNYLHAAGFQYTGDGDTACCKECGLEVSNWISDMDPFNIHREQRPNCPFVESRTISAVSNKLSSSLSTTAVRNTSISNEHENPSKRQKIESLGSKHFQNISSELDLIQQGRRHTFSHWPHRTIPSSAQMIEAGFFNCNVGDRVICIYCNLICQQWTPLSDDPYEVHKTLSPNCFYVKEKLTRPSAWPIRIINETLTGVISNNPSSTSTNLEPLRSNEIVSTIACNPHYAELPKRHASFATWADENLSLVDDLARAGFFYIGTKTIVTCFYCNGSLQNWGPNDNSMIEHARWFPHCGYVKQLCGDVVYQKIQESKRVEQEHVRADEAREKTNSGNMGNPNPTTNSRRLLIPDESTLSRLVAARLDLPIS